MKFTEIGSVRIVTQLVRFDHREPRLQFDVINSGIGMNIAQTAALFEPFTQADTSTTRQFGGTGLGLAISRRLARMLGGDITVACRPDDGCAFRLTINADLPEGVEFISEPTEAIAPTRKSCSKPAEFERELSCRILLAEDGPDNQRLLTFILTKAGGKVTVAANGQIAVERALAAERTERPFDIILMDMQMPVLDGYSATGQLRDAGYEKPIIALTAHAMSSDRAKCIAAGCDDYATKPVNREKLIDLIRTTLDNKNSFVDAAVAQ